MNFMITRYNYEEFFLLYVDNELSAADRQIVERFVAENPDLKEEWDLLLQCRIRPDHHLAFTGRESLLKPEGGLTGDAGNYEEYFLSYIDGELDEDARRSVEEFVRRHPSRRPELQRLQQTVSVPDPAIVFENKEILYKKERDRRVVLLPWRIAAAALVAGVIGLLIFNPLKKGPPERSLSAVPGNSSGPGNRPGTLSSGKDVSGNKESLAGKDQPGDSAALARTPAVKKNGLAVTSRPSAALHLSEAGQADGMAGSGKRGERNNSHTGPGNGKDDDPGSRTLAQTDPSVNKRAIDPTPVRIVGNSIDGPAGKALVVTALATDRPNARSEGNSSFATQALQNPSNGSPEDGFAMESSSSKKNRLRGIFRKVTRVLEKNTSRDEDDQRSVLIGGFQFALK
jgi:anti-sigma factor RsiW